MRIAHFQRKPFPGAFSLESHFDKVRTAMIDRGLDVRHCELPEFSKGLLPRLRNMAWARRNQASVNHICGDVHFLSPALCRDRTLLTICDLTILDYYGGVRRKLLKLLWYDIPVRFAGKISVISEATRQELLGACPWIPPQKITVVPISVDDRFQPHPRPFQKDCPRILQIGTKRQKNIERLCAALEGLDCHLHIVGNLSPEQCELLARYRIRHTAEKNLTDEQITKAYVDCDLVSFVSTQEGFGMPIVEAQCVERPVVTSDCSSMPEVAGNAACLVDPFDIESIRRGFRRVIHDADYRLELLEASRANRVRFSLSSVVDQYVALYQELAR